MSVPAKIGATRRKLSRHWQGVTWVKENGHSAHAIGWNKVRRGALVRGHFYSFDEWDEGAAIMERDGDRPLALEILTVVGLPQFQRATTTTGTTRKWIARSHRQTMRSVIQAEFLTYLAKCKPP